MEFTVVIPAFNEEKCLPATLRAVGAALAGLAAEVIVVDNQSTDRTAQIAAGAGARVIPETVHNIGRVRNTGARAAGGAFLIFIDADTLVPADLFRKMAVALRADEKCLGGAVAVDYGAFERRAWMRYYLAGWRFWGGFFDMKQGAAQFCRKTVFERLGGYDEEIYVGEDIEFYWRLAKLARRSGAYLTFIETPRVTTSPRRFDEMSLWKIFWLTNPAFIRLAWKRNAFWKDWYEKTVR